MDFFLKQDAQDTPNFSPSSLIYFTSDLPLEIISAFKLNPVRIPSYLTVKNNQISIDSIIQPFICSKVRSTVQTLLNIDFPFKFYIFSENYCDSLQNLADIFQLKYENANKIQKYRFLLPVKRGGDKEEDYYYSECKRLFDWLKNVTSREITVEELKDSINKYNLKRKLLQQISF